MRNNDRALQPSAGSLTLCLILGILLAFTPSSHAADTGKTVCAYDFEKGASLNEYPGLAGPKLNLKVVPRTDGGGQCLEIATPAPGKYCGPDILIPFEIQDNMVLSFDHREIAQDGTGSYLGVSVYTENKAQYWTSDTRFNDKWKTFSVPLNGIRLAGKQAGDGIATYTHTGQKVARINLYGRAQDQPQTTVRMTVWLDNIRIHVDENLPAGITDTQRLSYSAVPLFDWDAKRNTPQRLQYAADKTFKDPATVTVDLDRNFYAPPAPLKQGTWFYRHWLGNKKDDKWVGTWSPASQIIIPEPAHTYIAPPVPHDKLLARPHPRLEPMALLERKPPTDSEKADMKRAAKRNRELGVPEHPGLFDPKKPDPRWPEWIDWYGKVAGGITAHTGSRLTQVGETAVLTKDPEVIQWAKELAIDGCKWDPEGGSSMKAGDLQAADFLRGMTWCYDASCETMTPQERKKVRDILVQRANQFYDYLSPFRGNEAQNHSWNKATILARVALVLLGEYDEARNWLDCTVQVYTYRFLPSMGFQGDNQEGLPYWSYGGGIIARFTELMRFGCDVNLYDHPWLAQTGRFPVYCAPPEAYIVCFADESDKGNHGVKGPYGNTLVKLLGRRTADPYQLWYGGATDWPSGPGPKPPVDIPQSIHYRHIGWVIFNTSLVNGLEGVTVAMHSGKYFAGHQHADLNHFVINAYGDKLAVDGGYYDYYGSPHFNNYSVQTRAHNSILVNGEGQVWKKDGVDGKIDDYYDSPAYGYTVGNASHPGIYNDALNRFDRRFLFIKPRFLLVHDRIASAKGPAQYDWMIHSHTKDAFPADSAARNFRIPMNNAQLQGRIVAPANAQLRVEKAFDIKPRGKRSSQSLPDNEIRPEWTLYATPAEKAVKQEFLAAMHIQRLADGKAEADAVIEPIETTDNATGAALRYRDTRHIALFRKQDAAGPIAAEELETDGDAATVEIDAAGQIERAFAAHATFLKYKGKEIFQSPQPRDWSMDGLPEPAARPIDTAKVEIDGKSAPLQGYEQNEPEGVLRTWWCHIPAQTVTHARLAIKEWKGEKPPIVRLNNSQIAPRGSDGLSFAFNMTPGTHTVVINGRGTLEGIALTSSGNMKITDAKVMPSDFAPPAGAILIEAETPAKESTTKGSIWDKFAASGGKANCAWQDDGIWAEWNFDVPAAGQYILYIRQCTTYDDVVREFSIDGGPLVGQGTLRRLGNTGGWSRNENDWLYMAITDEQGAPAHITLTPGKHTLRMEYVSGAANTDCFVWAPVSK